MSNKAIASLASKLFAIYALIQAINYIQMATLQIASLGNVNLPVGGKMGMVIGSIVPVVLMIILAGGLWFFSDRVAAYLIPEDQEQEGRKPTTTDIEVIALAIIGVFACVVALPNLTTIFFNYWLVSRNQPNQILDAYSKVRLYSGLVQFILGLALALGSRGLVGLFRTLRDAGIKQG